MKMEEQQVSGMGKAMLVLAFIIVLGMMTWFFGGILEKQRNPNQQVLTSINTEGIPEVVLQQNRHGHYLATGSINDHPVDFLLDTGATDVAIPAKLAERLNLKKGPEIEISTANGVIVARMTRLDRVDLGNISVTNVRAIINPYMDKDDEVLLGMSFLKKLEMIQRGETLTLRQYYKNE